MENVNNLHCDFTYHCNLWKPFYERVPRYRPQMCINWWNEISWGYVVSVLEIVMNFHSKNFNLYIPIDVVLAKEFCDVGSDHYCSVTCNRCQESQNIIMLVGGYQRKPSRQWMLNPTFFALNGSLPSCLNSTKNNITNDGSHTKIRSPGLFINQGDILQHLVVMA